MSDLNTRLLAAHSEEDKPTLVSLYRLAADQAANLNACAFFLTQAYIFALEIGHPDAVSIRQRLVDLGRESPT